MEDRPANSTAATRSRGTAELRLLCIGLAAIVALFLALRAEWTNVPYFDDELGWYIPHALRIFDAPDPWVAFLSGLRYCINLFQGLLAAYWKLGGYSIPATRWFLSGLAAIAVLATGAAGWRLAGVRAGLAAAVLLALSPAFFFHAASGTPEALLTPLVALASYLVVRGRYSGAIALATAAALVKPTSAAFLLPIAVGRAFEQERMERTPRSLRRFLVKVAAAFVPATVGALVWFSAQELAPGVVVMGETAGGEGSFELAAAIARLGDPHAIGVTGVLRLVQFFAMDFRFLATLLAIHGIWSLLRLRRNAGSSSSPSDNATRMWVLTGMVILFVASHFVVGGFALIRYLVPAFPAFFVLAGAGTARLPGWQAFGAMVVTSFLFLSAHSHGAYFLGYRLAGWNDHRGFREMVVNYQGALSFVETNRGADGASIAANYPAAAMASDPRLGYVNHAFRTSPIPNAAKSFDCGDVPALVAGDQLLPVPQWVFESGRQRAILFGVSTAQVLVLERDPKKCRENSELEAQ